MGKNRGWLKKVGSRAELRGTLVRSYIVKDLRNKVKDFKKKVKDVFRSSLIFEVVNFQTCKNF